MDYSKWKGLISSTVNASFSFVSALLSALFLLWVFGSKLVCYFLLVSGV